MSIEILREGGIEYTWDGPDRVFKPFKYSWRHVPSGMTKVNTVYCMNRTDFLKLISYWNHNSDEWRYNGNISQKT